MALPTSRLAGGRGPGLAGLRHSAPAALVAPVAGSASGLGVLGRWVPDSPTGLIVLLAIAVAIAVAVVLVVRALGRGHGGLRRRPDTFFLIPSATGRNMILREDREGPPPPSTYRGAIAGLGWRRVLTAAVVLVALLGAGYVVFGARRDAALQPLVVSTPDYGMVQSQRTGPSPDSAASIVDSLIREGTASDAPVAMRTTPAPGQPVHVAVVSGGGVTAEQNGTVDLALRVDDVRSRPVPFVPVRFYIVRGGGSIAAARDDTDAHGMLHAKWKLGPDAGTAVAVAVAGGADGPLARITVDVQPPELALRPGLALGGTFSCDLSADGSVACWGGDDQGQLGGGATVEPPADSAQPTSGFAQLAAGVGHACALTREGAAYCWGGNARGQLGDGTHDNRTRPVAVTGGLRFRVITAGAAHTCALTYDDKAYCWGANDEGELGDDTHRDASQPTPVSDSLQFRSLAAGWRHTCGLDRAGHAYCWGENRYGQLGDGGLTEMTRPAAVLGGLQFRTLVAGSAHTCGITLAGAVYCWGDNNYGQLGVGDARERRQPTHVKLPDDATQISAGAVHTCALLADQRVYCWGRNTYGQLGDGTTGDRATPVAVAGDLKFTSVAASGAHTCGGTSNGAVYCWGYNVSGELGDGTRTDRVTPVRVTAAALSISGKEE